MKRSIEQWRGIVPEYVACDCSKAHIMYALSDAKDDIIQLYKFAERVSRLNKNAGEIGDGMLASLVEEAQFIIGETK